MSYREMPINVPTVVADTRHIHVTATRMDEETARTVCRYPANGEIVLDLTANISDGTLAIHVLDKAYWNITIDGGPATEADFQNMSSLTDLQTNAEHRTLTFRRI